MNAWEFLRAAASSSIRRFAGALLLAGAAAVGAAAGEPAPPVEVIVRLRDLGPHAVTDCAAAQHRRGRPLAAIARDRSDSLDRLNAELGVRAVRAVFRRSDGRPLGEARVSLAARARARREALPAQTRVALPPVPELAHVYRLALPPGADAAAAAARYAADPHVVWAQREPRRRARSDGERSVPRVERILGPALRRPLGDPARACARGLGPLAGRGNSRGRQRHGHRRAASRPRGECLGESGRGSRWKRRRRSRGFQRRRRRRATASSTT